MEKSNLVYFIVGFSICGLGFIILYGSIFQRLKKYHYATYQELGEPNLFRNSSIEKSKKQGEVLEFLRRKQYINLDDPILSKLCKTLKAFNIFFILMIVAYGFFNF